MTYPSLGSRLSLLIIIFRVSAGVLGNIDYQVDSGDLNVDFQAKSGDVSMAQEALYNSEVPAQARFHDGQASDSLVSGNQACPGPATLDIQSRSSDPRLDKNGDACKNGSPPTMEQKKKEHAPVDEDIIIPEAMPRWPSMQLQPNRQKCDHEIYSVPTCAMKEGARFISLFLYDLPACRPYFEGPCQDAELLWCCQLLVPTWLEPTMYWAYEGLNCALQTNLILL